MKDERTRKGKREKTEIGGRRKKQRKQENAKLKEEKGEGE